MSKDMQSRHGQELIWYGITHRLLSAMTVKSTLVALKTFEKVLGHVSTCAL